VKVGEAFGGLALLLRFGQGRQQKRRQNGNNSDDHQQFNQGEAFAVAENLRSHIQVEELTIKLHNP
jgi:uncharacterized protein YaiE (UPF0345 family)